MVVLGAGPFGVDVSVGGSGAYVTLLLSRGVAPDAAGLGMTLLLLGQFLAVLPADRLSRSVPVASVAALGDTIIMLGR